MTARSSSPSADGCTQITWHRPEEGGKQVLVSLDGDAVRIAVELGPEATRSAVETAWKELLREFDHQEATDAGPVAIEG